MPRFYLDAFARDGQIGTVELPGGRRFVRSVKNAATIKNFYTLDTADSSHSDAFEVAFGKLENSVAPILRKVIGDDTWPLDPEERQALAEFAAGQCFSLEDRPANDRDTSGNPALLPRVALGPGPLHPRDAA
ncbi:DUF4238 domain-containing protein [Amycolatopsis lurida]|uniref:DUF4238 domain-containing protein n=1 Tax=Amycolatopsis lurida NRRL 2430 TaxID=1460371 RepID=A0A2P2FU69_AMYLU|nr:DUF4238 domain-containing protein [Amycolatopsis lurida]KFU80263.1 hypothetical protein BB31_15660 [Amycolatopsis lurida NRRL 2430]